MMGRKQSNSAERPEVRVCLVRQGGDDIPLQFTLKRERAVKRELIDLFLLGLLMVLTVGYAHAQSTIARAQVAFDFTAGDTVLPPGEYTIVAGAADVALELLILRHVKGSVHEVAIEKQLEPRGNIKQARLVFLRYGARYFLSEVWLDASEPGCQMCKGSQEKELAEKGGEVQTAMVLASTR